MPEAARTQPVKAPAPRTNLKSKIKNQKSEILRLLEAGEAEQALSISEEALQVQPDDGELVMLHGIALGQVGRVDEAVGELRRATMLAPSDPETFYNLAVQLYDEGDRAEAAMAAQQALRIDPMHTRAVDLLDRCGLPPGSEPFEASSVPIAPSPQSLRLGLDDPVPHVLGLGEAWTWVGKGLLGLCLLDDILLIVHNPIAVNVGLKRDALSAAIIFLWLFTGVFGVFWMVVDLIDRRKRFVWLLPLSAFSICGLPVIPLALYLWIGRKN